ncbi:MAG: heat shock protein GrpE [Methanomassiliicoccales archaeon PtaU1.Bin124]|nr:MAG: heat shock protein GrpE [Methanomassiliicoccales archaeon PtaU1.Bin124]
MGERDEGGEPPETDCETKLAEMKEELRSLQSALEAETLRSKELLDTARRIQAEFDNYKKRSVRDVDEKVKAANDKLIAELLTVLDDLDRAAEADTNEELLRSGVEQVRTNLRSLLKGYGLREIPADRFDPQYHEAFGVGEGEDGCILEVYQKGYCLGPRVIRHTKVKVGKNQEKQE